MLKKLTIPLITIVSGALILLFALLPIGVTKVKTPLGTTTSQMGVYDIVSANSLSDAALAKEGAKIETKVASNPEYKPSNRENAIRIEFMQREGKAGYNENKALYDALPKGLERDAIFGTLDMDKKFSAVAGETIALIVLVSLAIVAAVVYFFFNNKWVFWTNVALNAVVLALTITVLSTMLSFSSSLKTVYEASFGLMSIDVTVTSVAGSAAILLPIFAAIATIVPICLVFYPKLKAKLEAKAKK